MNPRVLAYCTLPAKYKYPLDLSNKRCLITIATLLCIYRKMGSMLLTHYEILGVAENASIEEIKEVYKKLTLIYHPDKSSSPAAAAKFRQITQCYQVLVDPSLRNQYDKSLISSPIEVDFLITLAEMMEGANIKFAVRRQIANKFTYVMNSKTFDIHVSAGMKEGTRFIYHGDGNIDIGKRAGDVIFTLRQIEVTDMKRHENDLLYYTQLSNHQRCGEHYLVKLKLKDVLKFDMLIEVPLGNYIKPIVQTFPGLGFPDTKNPEIRGKLHAIIHVQ